MERIIEEMQEYAAYVQDNGKDTYCRDEVADILSMYSSKLRNALPKAMRTKGAEAFFERDATEEEVMFGGASWCGSCHTSCKMRGRDMLVACSHFSLDNKDETDNAAEV